MMPRRFLLLGLLVFPAIGSGGGIDSHIWTLAGSCAACHGTNGNSTGGTPVLAGLDKSHFILQLNAFRSGERSSTVMHRHAKGLTSQEIEQLAEFFSSQPRVQSQPPLPVGGDSIP